MRRDAVAELFDGEDGGVGAVEGDKVFGLQFGSARGGEVHHDPGRDVLYPRVPFHTKVINAAVWDATHVLSMAALS